MREEEMSIYGGMTNVYKILVGKSEGKRLYERTRRRWRIIIK
jgi:hypothetical protein